MLKVLVCKNEAISNEMGDLLAQGMKYNHQSKGVIMSRDSSSRSPIHFFNSQGLKKELSSPIIIIQDVNFSN